MFGSFTTKLHINGIAIQRDLYTKVTIPSFSMSSEHRRRLQTIPRLLSFTLRHESCVLRYHRQSTQTSAFLCVMHRSERKKKCISLHHEQDFLALSSATSVYTKFVYAFMVPVCFTHRIGFYRPSPPIDRRQIVSIITPVPWTHKVPPRRRALLLLKVAVAALLTRT